MTLTPSKNQLLEHLRVMLRDVFRLRNEGAAYAKLARAQGQADGYMRALLDAGVADQKQLLKLVSDERRAVDGPGSAPLEVERDGDVTVAA